MVVTVREATLEDAEVIAIVDIASHQAAYGDIFNHDDPSRRDFEPVVAKWQNVFSLDRESRPARVVLVAVEGQEIVGYSTLGHSRDEDAQALGEVLTMYVAPERWRHGIGHQLMRSAIGWLRERHFEAATLWVLEENERARAFMRRRDGSRTERGSCLRRACPGRKIAEVRYRRVLV
jgi:ribosomal protein S18 acetylase RimI-like enzyme